MIFMILKSDLVMLYWYVVLIPHYMLLNLKVARLMVPRFFKMGNSFYFASHLVLYLYM